MLRKLLSKSLQHEGSSSLESENEKRVCWILSMALTLPPPVSYQLQHTLHFIQKENEKTLQIIILRNTDQVHVIKLHLIKNSYSLKLNSNTQKIVLLPIYLSAALRRDRRHGAAEPEMLNLSRTSFLYALTVFTHLNHASFSQNFRKFVSVTNQLISSHTEASLGISYCACTRVQYPSS